MWQLQPSQFPLGTSAPRKSLLLPSWQQVGQSQEEEEEKCTVPGVS